MSLQMESVTKHSLSDAQSSPFSFSVKKCCFNIYHIGKQRMLRQACTFVQSYQEPCCLNNPYSQWPNIHCEMCNLHHSVSLWKSNVSIFEVTILFITFVFSFFRYVSLSFILLTTIFQSCHNTAWLIGSSMFSVASLKYHAPDTQNDTPTSHTIPTLGQCPSSTPSNLSTMLGTARSTVKDFGMSQMKFEPSFSPKIADDQLPAITEAGILMHMSRSMTKPTCVPSKVFTVCMKQASVLSYQLNAQQRLWSDWADAQADLSLHCAHMPFYWFCRAAGQLCIVIKQIKDNCDILMKYKKRYILLRQLIPSRYLKAGHWQVPELQIELVTRHSDTSEHDSPLASSENKQNHDVA